MTARTLLTHYGRQFGTLAGLLGLCLVLWILTPHFLTVSNLLNVAQQTAINAIIAVGLTFMIISGGIDLSVGSIVALSGVVLASLLQQGVAFPLAILASLGVGLGCGLVNGQPIAGLSYEFDAIAAAVIGGASLLGGQGSVVSTLIGVLRNGLNLVGVSSFVQQIVIGAVIILAVLVDMALKQPRK
jgi:ribose transport system permease protein